VKQPGNVVRYLGHQLAKNAVRQRGVVALRDAQDGVLDEEQKAVANARQIKSRSIGGPGSSFPSLFSRFFARQTLGSQLASNLVTILRRLIPEVSGLLPLGQLGLGFTHPYGPPLIVVLIQAL